MAQLGGHRHTHPLGESFFTQAPASIPQICTLQDLHFAEHPESMSKASFTHYSKLNHFAVNAAMNICSSQATAADAQRIFGIAPSLLRVIYPGFTARTTPSQSAIDAASGKFELPPQFLLCVGTIEPRKNISRLLRAYHTALQELDNVLPPLVLAGRRGYQSDAILHEIEELQLTGRVKHLPEVSDTEIDCLYSRCSAVLYPSLYEGFGFPVLEAMAAGKPVLTSKISSLPEVAGDAAYFVDPLSIGSIAQGIAALTTDGDLRARLIELGKTRPSRFTWKSCAEQTLEVYRECLSSKTARSAHA